MLKCQDTIVGLLCPPFLESWLRLILSQVSSSFKVLIKPISDFGIREGIIDDVVTRQGRSYI